MCGIAGYVDFSPRPIERRILDDMVSALRHRGPDACGVWIGQSCGLAHTRLSVIDLAGSSQPMQVPDDELALVYNGELYNYRSLRAELAAAGVSFVSRGDTEVILRHVARYWNGGLDDFDGMFAVAVWDMRRNRLLLARDPIGVKPLYFAQPDRWTIVFGSEPKAILQHPNVQMDLSTTSLQQVLRFRTVYGNESLYTGIRQLSPGSWLEFSPNGVREGRYYSLAERSREQRSQVAQLNEGQILRRFEEIFTSSIRKRMVSDVEVGAFLSGGLDSSLVTWAMKAETKDRRVSTFAAGFSGDAYSELPFARTVANVLETDHTEVLLTEADYSRLLPELSQYRDAPVSEPADVAIAVLSRVAREKVKVVLTGEGSDEAFCGYPKYRFANAPRMLRAALRVIGAGHAARLAGFVGMDRRRAGIASNALSQAVEAERLAHWFSYLDREALHRLFPVLDWSDEAWGRTVGSQTAVLANSMDFTPEARMQLVDELCWLPGNLLERGDRMTMQAGLEAREPFVDKYLVPFGVGLPTYAKVGRGSLKSILRRYARDKLPSVVLERAKCGFRVPLAQWFRGPLKPMLFDYLTSSRGICAHYGDRKTIVELLELHDRGRRDLDLGLWTLLTTEIWYQDAFQRSPTKAVLAA